MKNLLRMFWLLLLLSSCATPEKLFINPFSSKPPGYTQVVAVRGGKTIYVSGQVPVNAQGEIIGKGDFATQTRQVFENLQKALESAGATFNDVVKTNIYIKNFTPEYLSVFREIRGEYVSGNNPPASTLAGVQSLYHPDVLIEIEAVAVIRK